MIRRGVLNALEKSDDPYDNILNITFSYHRHGKIVQISDDMLEQSERFPFFFSTWCEEKGIVESNMGGYKYDHTFLKNLEFPDNYNPKLVIDEKVTILKSLACLLYEIDRVIDVRRKNDYLIALTACGEHESYLYAIREELYRFYENRHYHIQMPYDLLKKYLITPANYDIQDIKRADKFLRRKSYSAINDVKRKKKLRDDYLQYCQKIDDYFDEAELYKGIAYRQNLKPYISMTINQRKRKLNEELRKEIIRIDSLGDLSLKLAEILKSLYALLIGLCETKKNKDGSINRRSLKVVNSKVENLLKSQDKWNKSIHQQLSLGLNDFPINDLVSFSEKNVCLFNTYDILEFNNIAVPIMDKYSQNIKLLENIYKKYYNMHTWRQRSRMLFSPASRLDGTKSQSVISEAIDISIREARKCVSEDNKVRPKVAAVVIKNDKIIKSAFRGEMVPGEHAEYTLLMKKCRDLDLEGATLITTLEPCTSRNHPKKPCVNHIIDKGIKKVVIGLIDPNPKIRGKGYIILLNHDIKIEFFNSKQLDEIKGINKDFFQSELKKYMQDMMSIYGEDFNTHKEKLKSDFYIGQSEFMKNRIIINIIESWDEKKLQGFCSYVRIEYSILQGKTIPGKIIELIDFFQQNKSIVEFNNGLKQYDPDLWQKINGGI